ncbi:MAG TPA: hypothetical protein VFW11_23275 [Cyclobacteriaceae bacterium]|nr:hypothetical protein [Cyclobacteriaceae bacterium]
MKKLPLLLLLNFFISAVEGQDVPTAAPAIKTFALQQDVVGAASNSVNLFTGDVALPINLVSLPGRNGLDANVTVSYSSNVHHIVDTWNLEAPTGVLGLGWSLDIPKIVADHKQTGTREDDEYYLLEGGMSNRLVRTLSGSDASGVYNVYETKNYQFWKIKFYYASTVDKWEIIREDGTKYIYGDKNSGRSTVQYVVRWNNWIGNSAQTANQSQLAVAWNLSEVVNQWDDKIMFKYENIEQFVGSASGQKHTEASYINEITDVVGRKIQFFYGEKNSQYFMEPHTESSEPDAYQEVYEKKYLDHIDVLDGSASKFLSIHFGYGSINTGTSTAKMLLTSIEQRNGISTALPQMKFEYNTDGPAKGCMKTVTYPTGGAISYEYSKKEIGRSKRELNISAPTGFAEPKVWIEDDYVLVTWRKLAGSGHDSGPQDVQLYVYQWVGEWKEQFLQTLTGIELSSSEDHPDYHMEYKNFQVVTLPNFFAVLTGGTNDNYSLIVRYKDPGDRGGWKSYSHGANYGEGTPMLLGGSNFLVVASFKDDSTHPCYRFVFNGDGWTQTVLNQTSGDHYYTFTNNYFISHNRSGTGGPEINFNYLTEDRKWVTKNWNSGLLFSSDGQSGWYSANSFAFVLADDNPEYIYRWDQSYNTFYRDTKDVNNNDIFGSISDNLRTFLINNNMIGASGHLARYDGKYWYKDFITSTHNSLFGFYFSYGDDMVVRPSEYVSATVNYKGARKVFDPNSLQWLPDVIMDGADRGPDIANAGIDYYYFGNGYYYRAPDGTWQKKITYTGTSLSNLFGIKGGYPRMDARFKNTKEILEVVQFKNGELASYALPGVKLLDNSWFIRLRSNAVGNQTVVSYPSSVSDDQSLTTTIQLNRIIKDGLSGKLIDYPVSLVTTSNYGQTQYTSFDYNVAKAVIDVTGNVVMYNEVTVIPGSLSPISKPNGFTKNFFHNGLGYQELFVSSFPTDLRWVGLPYETQVYDNNGNLVSYSKTSYTTYAKDLLNSDGVRVEVGHYVRATSTEQMSDGVVVTTNNSYDSNTGLVTQTSVSAPISTQTYYKYFWEAYDPTRSKNILTPVISTKRRLNNQDIDANVVRYKNWTSTNNPSGVFAPFDQYTWKSTGTPDFTSWDVATNPSSDWVFTGKVSVRETIAGTAIESVQPGGLSQAMILNVNNSQVLARASNALVNDIAFTSFEDTSTGNFTLNDGASSTGVSKTGTKFFTLGTLGITRSGLNASETYKVSFWAKPASGSVNIDGVGTVSLGTFSDWTLFEYTVTGRSSITVKKTAGTVLIDELRLHPEKSTMSTFTYHPVYGQESAMDHNNQVIYQQYDEWGRPKNTLDEDSNILTTQFYNYKN